MSSQMSVEDTMRLPVHSEEHTFGSWLVKFNQSHILHSKCSKDNICKEAEVDPCLFCLYTRQLKLPHMPDMVFPNNNLQLQHSCGSGIEFNTLDALKKVSNGHLNLKIACADAWLESRQEPAMMEQVKPFDWTFTTDYKGTVMGHITVEETDEKIDMNKLKQKEKILFYHDLTLYEDELHDNGIAVCSVKIRVMPNSFFILLRYFLRVDNVKVKINDTRLYHEYNMNYVLREYTSRESDIQKLKVPPAVLTEPNEVAPLLPIVQVITEKLILPGASASEENPSGSL